MLTGYVSHRGVIASDDRPRDRLETVTRWLANQRAVPLGQVEPTAWAIIESYRDGKLVLEGSAAPIVVQQRFALWIVGQLGGRPLIRVLVDQAAAIEKARELGAELRVPVLVIGPAGEIAERFDPSVVPPPMLATPAPAPMQVEAPAPLKVEPPPVTLKVARFEDRWAVFVADRVVATAPTRERARQRARVLKADPDFMANPRPLGDE